MQKYLDRYRTVVDPTRKPKRTKQTMFASTRIIDAEIDVWNPVLDIEDAPVVIVEKDRSNYTFKKDGWVEVGDIHTEQEIDGGAGNSGLETGNDWERQRRSHSPSPPSISSKNRAAERISSRRSPSVSPDRFISNGEERKARWSPSLSPERFASSGEERKSRRSPSVSPERIPSYGEERKSRRSPSPSPERIPSKAGERSARGSPSPSPERIPFGVRESHKRRSPSPSPQSKNRFRRSPSPSPPSFSSSRITNVTKERYESHPKIKPERNNQAHRSQIETDKPATIQRDKYGKKIDLEAVNLKSQKDQQVAEQQMEWGSGLVQKRQREQMADRLKVEADTEFAVYGDDEHLNEQQKESVRWGDPMANMVTKSKSRARSARKGPPNRFGVLPGHRWDGIERGIGFEVKYFQHQHESKAFKKDFHRWSTEDM